MQKQPYLGDLLALEKDFGDLVVANLTITPAKKEQVDFSTPVLKQV